ncbi:MAG: YtxH domain-containing protein, partial [Bacteroidetes bacterium]|nr:YtxH domain-containing protein [Bacteroidota bacterium]
MSAQKILIGTLSGLLAGVAIGMLVAPDKGSETRAKISEGAASLKKKLRKLRGAAADELEELQEVFEHEVAGLKDDVRERVLTLINTAKANGKDLKNQ